MEFLEPLEDGRVKHEFNFEYMMPPVNSFDLDFLLNNSQCDDTSSFPGVDHIMNLGGTEHEGDSAGDFTFMPPHSVPSSPARTLEGPSAGSSESLSLGPSPKDECSASAPVACSPKQRKPTGCSVAKQSPAASSASVVTANASSSVAVANTTCSSASPVASQEDARRRRAEALRRYQEKKNARCFKKIVRYECRKKIAATRPRVSGRFAKKSEAVLGRIASVDSLLSEITSKGDLSNN